MSSGQTPVERIERSSRRPIRVCHICSTAEGGTWLLNQLRELRDRFGYEVAAILPHDRGRLAARLRDAGIRVLTADMDFITPRDFRTPLARMRAIRAILERERFDIVQTHLFNAMILGRIAAWFADVPVRLAMVAGPFHLEAWTPRWMDRSTCWMETAVISSCAFMHTLYRRLGMPERRIELVYYGADPTEFDPAKVQPADVRAEHGWAPDAPLVVMVAYFYALLGRNRWIPEVTQGRSVKRQDDFIQAARLILDERPEVRFLLVGSGWEQEGRDYLAEMKALATSLDLDSCLHFAGFVDSVPVVLRAADVAVQPSINENLGGTIESLLLEVPTVATRVGGLVDAVVDGETGVLVEPLNPADLKRGILYMIDHSAEGRRMAARGRQWMLENATLDRTVEQLDVIYRRRLSESATGYRPLAQAWRRVFGSLLCGPLLLRFVWLDLYRLPLWDAGWRPWTTLLWWLRYPFYVTRHRVLPTIQNAALRSLAAWRWRIIRLRAWLQGMLHAVWFQFYKLRHRVLPVVLNTILRWRWALRLPILHFTGRWNSRCEAGRTWLAGIWHRIRMLAGRLSRR